MLKYISVLLAATVSLAIPSARAADAPTHDKEFWRAVAKNEGKLPAGLQPRALAPELIDDLASTDAELRDGLAYDVLLLWIYKGALTPDEIRPLMSTLLANLRAGVGENDTDGVFRRSYSALILSLIVARNNEQPPPFLTPEEYRILLDAALAYLADEKDERGFDPQKGWVHSVAHTADLLKFLARDPRLTPADQTRVLDGLRAKLHAATAAYTHGEDERLARVVIALARRDDLDKEALSTWVQGVTLDATFLETPTPEGLRLTVNAHHLLTGLCAELSVDGRPSAGLDFLRPLVREALRKMF